MARVSVCLVTWNGAKFIKGCLDSLEKQTYRDFEIQILDNGSIDETREILKKDYPQINVEYQNNNLGFSRAYNKLMLRARGEYVFVVNQDTILDEQCVAELVKTLDENSVAGVVGPLLYRLIDFEKSEVIDSFGLAIKKNYQAYDEFAGETLPGGTTDHFRLDLRARSIELDDCANREVFGVSGAMLMLRKSALESVRFDNEYFDNDFFAYKEDVDLAMCLRLLGWSAFINTSAVAWHFRTGKSDKKKSAIKQYLEKSFFVKFYSFRNQLLFVDKTAQWGKYWFFIMFNRLQRHLLVLFLSPKIWWRAIRERSRLKKRILQKRQSILKYIKNSDLSKWMK
jgi:GT2 family glycosyltransferase